MVKQVCPTPGFGKLLLATDGSLASRKAVDEAVRIASACSGKLFVLSVLEVNAEYEFWDPRFLEKAAADLRRHLAAVKKKASRAGVACEVILHQAEEPYEYIVAEAKKRKVDTIIMGSHGRTGLTRLMMGSVTSRVIGHAPCKVLVVPTKRKN